MIRNGLAGSFRHCGQNRGQLRDLLGRRRYDVGGEREQVREARGIQQRDLCALMGGLAHTVRENRHLAAQVGTNHQQRAQGLHIRDRHTEIRERRIRILVAEVALPQTVIDVVGSESAREPPGEVQLLERAGAAGQDTQVLGAGLQPRRGLRKRRLPIGLDPRGTFAD